MNFSGMPQNVYKKGTLARALRSLSYMNFTLFRLGVRGIFTYFFDGYVVLGVFVCSFVYSTLHTFYDWYARRANICPLILPKHHILSIHTTVAWWMFYIFRARITEPRYLVWRMRKMLLPYPSSHSKSAHYWNTGTGTRRHIYAHFADNKNVS